MSNEEIRQSEKTGITPFAFRVYEEKKKTDVKTQFTEELVSSLVYLPNTLPKVWGCHVFSRGRLDAGVSQGTVEGKGSAPGYNINLTSDRPRDIIQSLYAIKRLDDKQKGGELVFYPGKAEVRNTWSRNSQVDADTGKIYDINRWDLSVSKGRIRAYERRTGEEWSGTDQERERTTETTGVRYEIGTVKRWNEDFKLDMYGGAERYRETVSGAEATKSKYVYIGGTYYKLNSNGQPIFPFPVATFDVQTDQEGVRRTELRAQEYGFSRAGGYIINERDRKPELGLTYHEGWTADRNFSVETAWGGNLEGERRWKGVDVYGNFNNLKTKVGYNARNRGINFGLDYSF